VLAATMMMMMDELTLTWHIVLRLQGHDGSVTVCVFNNFCYAEFVFEILYACLRVFFCLCFFVFT